MYRVLAKLALLPAGTLLVFGWLRSAHGTPTLDPHQPILLQYLGWLFRILRGDLGWSPSNAEPVSQAIAERLPATIELVVVALVAAVVLGAVFGFAQARAAGPRWRGVVAVPSLICRSVPVFLLALGLQLFVVVVLRLELFGYSSTESFDVRDRLAHLILPVLCLAMPFGAWSSLIFADFFRAHRSSWRIARPVTMTVALIGPALVAASILVETLFAWPGVGRLWWNAFGQDDAAVIAGILLTYIVAVVMLELCDAVRTACPDAAPAGRRTVFSTLGIVALVVLGIAVLGAAAANVIAPVGPYFVDQVHWQGYPLPPGGDGHSLGTDENGRDLLARLLVGLRVSLGVAVFATLIATVIAFVVATAGKTLPWLGVRRALVASGIRPFAALPFIFAAIAILYRASHRSAIAPSSALLGAVIGVVSWPALVSSFRAPTAVMLGGITGFAGCALVLEVTLSMVGLGVQPPTPSLGNILANAQSNVMIAPWAVFIPAATIIVMLCALYALADDLREHDPSA